jgi:indole-3-glycerol phosphate synthase
MGTLQSVAGDFLSRILRDKREEVAARREAEPEYTLRRRADLAMPPRPDILTMRGDRLRVIAEVKRGSPSAGTFDAGLDAAAQAALYAGAGAAAVSVLTDGPYFQGSLDDLAAVRRAVAVPLLRKDFIIDPYQLYEARAAGADLVLLIVAALERSALGTLLALTHELGMEALVEVNTEEEAHMAVAAGARLAGINNRNLRSFEVDMATTGRLRPLFPPETIVAGLSGIRTVEDARRLRAAGADAVLVGEALVRATDPAALLATLREVD